MIFQYMSDRETYLMDYGASLLRRILHRSDAQIAQWRATRFDESRIPIPMILHEPPVFYVTREFIPRALKMRIRGSDLMELHWEIADAIEGADDPDYAAGANTGPAEERINQVLSEYGETLASLWAE